MSSPKAPAAQLQLIAGVVHPLATLDCNHRYVQVCEELDWVALEQIVQEIRRQKLKSRRGRKPNLRPLIGAVILMGLRSVTYRDAEDLIRHYAPARYLCGLIDSDWTPDFTTIQDFTNLLGAEGMAKINEFVVKRAVVCGVADSSSMVADATAQEAAISYPTEVGLMATFLTAVAVASKNAGRALGEFAREVANKIAEGKRLLRKHRLFAKTKEARMDVTQKLHKISGVVQRKLKGALTKAKFGAARLHKYKKVAHRKLENLCETMGKLQPQIRSWIETGFVAKNKIVNLFMPEVRAIPRGKVGKTVEFGLKWGLSRIGGGFLLGAVDVKRPNFGDRKHAIEAVEQHIELFGAAPESYAYDRGGYSAANMTKLAALGVVNNGVAPVGQALWAVDGAIKKRLVTERARIEGDIGSIKTTRYGFNRPRARSTTMMVTCGHRAILGYNLNKLARRLHERTTSVATA